MKLHNDIILRAARGEKTERSPVWLMRQAGRILPEYRAVRAKLSGFIELVETPERAAEVTISRLISSMWMPPSSFRIFWLFPRRWDVRIR